MHFTSFYGINSKIMRRTSLFSLIVLLAIPPLLSAQPNAPRLNLNELLRAVDAHPMLAMARYQQAAAGHRIAMRGSLMDPMLMLGVENLPTNSFKFNQDGMTGKSIGISQNFPFPGKLQLEREIAAIDTVTAGNTIEEQANTLRRTIKQNYYELYHLTRSIATNTAHVETISELEKLAEKRLELNGATQTSVLALKIEIAETKSQIIDERSMFAMREAELLEAAGLASGTIAIPDSLPIPPFFESLIELDAIAKANRAALQRLSTQVEGDRLSVDRTNLDRYPDFNIALMFMQRDALDAYSPMAFPELMNAVGMTPIAMPQSNMLTARISFPIPIDFGGKRKEAVAELEAMSSMTRAEFGAKSLEIHSMLASDLARLDGLREQYKLLIEEIGPLAESSVRASNAAFEYSNTTVDQVLRNELNVLHKEHQKFQLEAEYRKTIADIEFQIGKDIMNTREENKQ